MIVDDFDVLSAGIGPSETHSELIVDPDAVLPFPIALKRFQTIPGWNAKILQPPCDIQLAKLAAGHHGKISKALYLVALGQGLSVGTPKGSDHQRIITR